MKRKQNDLEMLFNELSNKSSTILFRGIMLFPFAAILGYIGTIKLVMPFVHELTTISLENEVTIFATSIIMSCTIYFLTVLAIYDDTLEKEQQKIAHKIMRELEKQGELSTKSEYARKKYIREIRKMSEGRKVKD